MMINIGDILVLSDKNEYIVISEVNYNEKDYFYLTNKNNNEIKFCYLDEDELVEINDEILITNLLPLFLDKAQKLFDNNNY